MTPCYYPREDARAAGEEEGVAEGDASNIGPESRGWDYLNDNLVHVNDHVRGQRERPQMGREEAIQRLIDALREDWRHRHEELCLNHVLILYELLQASPEEAEHLLEGTSTKREDF